MKTVNGLMTMIAAAALAMAGVATAQQGQPPAGQPAPHKDHDKNHKHGEKGDKDKKHEGEKKKVATGVHVGDTAPDFKLKDTDGKEHSLADLTKEGKVVVLVWFNADCPFVKKHFIDGSDTFKAMADKFKDKSVVMLAINSGAKGKEGSGIERNQKAKKDWKIACPILMDEEGTIGRAYGSKNTPATYVVGKDGKVAYVGAIDDDSSAKKPGKVNYAINAVEELLAGKAVTNAETKPYGCSVKYGN